MVLDRDLLVATVLRLAGRHGIEGLSMRLIATELGVAAPSLYHHVPNKQSILDLVAEAALSAVVIPQQSEGSWDARLRLLYLRGRAQLLPISGIASVLQSRPLSPPGLALDAASIALLREAGLDLSTARAAHALLNTHLLGSVILTHAGAPVVPAATGQRTFRYGLDVIIEGIRAKEGLR